MAPQGVWFPLGFPLQLTTNSAETVCAIEQSWGDGKQAFDARPLRLQVTVSAGGKSSEPAFHIDGHWLAIIADRENYAVADLEGLSAWCRVTSGTVADGAWFRWFFLDALILSLLAQKHTVPVHAGCVARAGSGVLLFGSSGAGKSTLAWACARAGWSLVGDDAAWLLPKTEPAIAIGRPQQVRLRPDAPRHFPELAGLEAKARPNGKMSIELRTREFPQVLTAGRTDIERVLFLERGEGAEMVPVARETAFEAMLRDCVPYRAEVHARHKETVSQLAKLPAFRLQYQSLDEALELLRC